MSCLAVPDPALGSADTVFPPSKGTDNYPIWDYYPEVYRKRRETDADASTDLRILSWNIQNLGTTKGTRSAVMDGIAEVLYPYDIVVIQELSQNPGTPCTSNVCGPCTGTVICAVLTGTNAKRSAAGLGPYTMTASEFYGSEQYVVMYDSTVVTLLQEFKWENTTTPLSRPPMVYEFTTKTSTPGRSSLLDDVIELCARYPLWTRHCVPHCLLLGH